MNRKEYKRYSREFKLEAVRLAARADAQEGEPRAGSPVERIAGRHRSSTR